MPKDKGKAKPQSKKKDNSVGLTEVRKSRSSAIKALAAAKELEAERVKSGYRWLTNDKKTIFVAPDRIEHYLYSGYRVISPK